MVTFRVRSGTTGRRKKGRHNRRNATGVLLGPTRRSRTQLTETEVAAIRTARQNGDSVISICRRFDIHRMTVWAHTKEAN